MTTVRWCSCLFPPLSGSTQKGKDSGCSVDFTLHSGPEEPTGPRQIPFCTPPPREPNTEQKMWFDPRDFTGLETQDESNPIKKKDELLPSPEARRSFLCLNTIKISALAKWHVTSTGRAEKRCNYLIITAECWRRSEDHSRHQGSASGRGGEGVTARGGGLLGGRKANTATGTGQEEGQPGSPTAGSHPRTNQGPSSNTFFPETQTTLPGSVTLGAFLTDTGGGHCRRGQLAIFISLFLLFPKYYYHNKKFF